MKAKAERLSQGCAALIVGLVSGGIAGVISGAIIGPIFFLLYALALSLLNPEAGMLQGEGLMAFPCFLCMLGGLSGAFIGGLTGAVVKLKVTPLAGAVIGSAITYMLLEGWRSDLGFLIVMLVGGALTGVIAGIYVEDVEV